MTHETTRRVQSTSRRTFCRVALAATLAVPARRASTRAEEAKTPAKFYKVLAPGHVGVNANQQQAVAYAIKYGFAGVAPGEDESEGKSTAQILEWVAAMKEAGIRYGTAGLPVEFREDDARFERSLATLPRRADLLRRLGVTRVATWLMPGHNKRTYLQNFKLHETRLRAAAKVLVDAGIRLGLEFVGPRTARNRLRFPFISTQLEMLELVESIGTGNVGILLDSWHWYTSHGTVDELLRLTDKDIVHVHVNDAPSGVAIDEQVDNRRKLPATTGVIDMKGFINALVKIGYEGPVECEPFDAELRKLEPDAIVKATADALGRVWGLIAT
jgi:sugar phosphate isomerase/epimerase